MRHDADRGQGWPGWITRRQRWAAARRVQGWTQRRIGIAAGVSQQAISKRLKSFQSKLTPRQLELFRKACRQRYGKALSSGGRRLRIKAIKI